MSSIRRSGIFLFVLVMIGLMWTAEPFVGTWKMDVSRYRFNPPGSALKSYTVVVGAQDNGFKFTFHRVNVV
jgi:hypothetical protein